jgi:type I restriction enzyme, S subunit
LIIEYPDYPTQQKIVKQLNAIKNKIIVLQNQNHTLEQIAQNIFKSWFVDFDGVTEFEDSELGKIPKGWSAEKLEHLPVEIIDGDRGINYPKQNEFYKKEYCLFLSAKNISGHTFNFQNISFINKEKDVKLRKGKLQRNDFILTTRGTVGNFALYHNDILYDQIRINSGMVILRCNEKLFDSYFLLCCFRNNYIHEQIQNMISGTAQPQFPIRDLQKLLFIIPPRKIIEKSNLIIKPVLTSIFKNEKSISILTKTRDTLLPKLMSGEIRV